MRPKAIDVKPLEDYMLLVIFENGEKKIFDVKPYLTHKAFEQLNDKALFNTVKSMVYQSVGLMVLIYVLTNYIIIAKA